MDGPKARRSGMESRNRSGNTPPPRAGRKWAVEGRRVGGPGDGVGWCGVRRDRFVRAVAAVVRRHAAVQSAGSRLLTSPQWYDISRISLQSPLNRVDQCVRSEGFSEQSVAAGLSFEPGDV